LSGKKSHAAAERIAGAKAFIFDMDGTIALGDKASGGHVAIPGAVELLDRLRTKGVPYRVFTNGSAKPPAAYAASLRAAGFDLADDEMMTPSSSAAAWFVAQKIGRVRVLGNPGTIAPIADAGIEVIGPADPAEGVEAVFTGWFREFGFPHLEAACRDIWNGAGFTTASHVPFFATQDGRGIGTSFAINAAITALTETKHRVLGKPSREAFFCAVKAMGLRRSDADRVVVVGDDPALETRMANRCGAVSVGVATGLQTIETWAETSEKQRPALAVESVESLRAFV